MSSLQSRIQSALSKGTIPAPEEVSTIPLLSSPAENNCIHLGSRLDGQPCGSQLFHCNKFSEITTRFVKCDKATRHCATCKDFKTPVINGGFPEPPSQPLNQYLREIGARHLLFHILPVANNGIWQHTVNQLRLRWSLFTGRKIVAIAQGNPVYERIDPTERVPPGQRMLGIDSFEAVVKLLPKDCEVIIVPNDPNLWEGISWPLLWESLFSSSTSPNDVVFYGHAKGVTRKLTSPCHKWTDLLFTTNLDYWPLIEKTLLSKPVCGSLPKWGAFFGGLLINSQWHYSGNFWWGRVGVLREKISSIPLPVNQWSTEAWVGVAFHRMDAGVIFESRPIRHLYHPHELDSVMEDFTRWSNMNSHYLTGTQSIT